MQWKQIPKSSFPDHPHCNRPARKKRTVERRTSHSKVGWSTARRRRTVEKRTGEKRTVEGRTVEKRTSHSKAGWSTGREAAGKASQIH